MLFRSTAISICLACFAFLFMAGGADAADLDLGDLLDVNETVTTTTEVVDETVNQVSATHDDETQQSPDEVTDTVSQTLETVTQPVVEDVVEPVTQSLEPVTTTVNEVVEPVVTELEPVVDSVTDTVGPAIEAVEPIVQDVEPIVQDVTEVVVPVVESVEPVVDPVLDTLEPVSESVEPILEPGVQVVEPVLEAVAPVTDPVLEIGDPVVDPVEDVVVPDEPAAVEPPVAPDPVPSVPAADPATLDVGAVPSAPEPETVIPAIPDASAPVTEMPVRPDVVPEPAEVVELLPDPAPAPETVDTITVPVGTIVEPESPVMRPHASQELEALPRTDTGVQVSDATAPDLDSPVEPSSQAIDIVPDIPAIVVESPVQATLSVLAGELTPGVPSPPAAEITIDDTPAPVNSFATPAPMPSASSGEFSSSPVALGLTLLALVLATLRARDQLALLMPSNRYQLIPVPPG